MNSNRALWLTALTLALSLGVQPLAAGEGYLDQARVLEAQPLFGTRSVSVQTEICAYEPHSRAFATDAELVGNTRRKNPSIGLLDALKTDIELRSQQDPEYRCRTVTRPELRPQIVAYRVRYQYGSRVYEQRMPRDPGEFVRVQVHLTPLPNHRVGPR